MTEALTIGTTKVRDLGYPEDTPIYYQVMDDLEAWWIQPERKQQQDPYHAYLERVLNGLQRLGSEPAAGNVSGTLPLASRTATDQRHPDLAETVQFSAVKPLPRRDRPITCPGAGPGPRSVAV